jgi:hypothetical protein
VSDLEPIGGEVEALLARIGLPAVPPLVRLLEAWDAIAGEPWTGSRPAGLDSGTLVIEVADGVQASVLSYQTGPLLRRLEEVLGPGVVEAVRIRVADPKKARKIRDSETQ